MPAKEREGRTRDIDCNGMQIYGHDVVISIFKTLCITSMIQSGTSVNIGTIQRNFAHRCLLRKPHSGPHRVRNLGRQIVLNWIIACCCAKAGAAGGAAAGAEAAEGDSGGAEAAGAAGGVAGA